MTCEMKRLFNIGIIGAGLSGLCAAKYAKSSGHSVTIFEQNSKIGGTWTYTDLTDKDEYGLDIHSSMYYDLRTNLPKEIMGFHDFPMPDSSHSYVTSDEVLSFLKMYANHFDLNKLVKFRHHVIRVRPIIEGTRWEVMVKNLQASQDETYNFDAIFVCNGHNSVPLVPQFEGSDKFQGKQIHSHFYRRAEEFKGKKVLIIGSGPTGIDLTFVISKEAEKLIFSHHTHNHQAVPENVFKKGRVKKFTKNSVIFDDDSEEDITDVVYCTGFKFSMPFVGADNCGICTTDNYVSPLYKNCINAKYPTMTVLGYVFQSAFTQVLDVQVRFVMHYLNGEGVLPSESEMLADVQRYLDRRLSLNMLKSKGNSIIGILQREYFDDLTSTARIENYYGIYMDIYDDCAKQRNIDRRTYRNDVYKLINKQRFERRTLHSTME